MATIGSGMNGSEESDADRLPKSNGFGSLNTLEAFHQRLTGIEDCCLEILGFLPNLERQTIETEKQWKAIAEQGEATKEQWKAIAELRKFFAGLTDELESNKTLMRELHGLTMAALASIGARIKTQEQLMAEQAPEKRHPGAER